MGLPTVRRRGKKKAVNLAEPCRHGRGGLRLCRRLELEDMWSPPTQWNGMAPLRQNSRPSAPLQQEDSQDPVLGSQHDSGSAVPPPPKPPEVGATRNKREGRPTSAPTMQIAVTCSRRRWPDQDTGSRKAHRRGACEGQECQGPSSTAQARVVHATDAERSHGRQERETPNTAQASMNLAVSEAAGGTTLVLM